MFRYLILKKVSLIVKSTNTLLPSIFGTISNLLGGLLLFPEDESGESSQQEEEESEAGTDEPDNEEYVTEDQLERRR